MSDERISVKAGKVMKKNRLEEASGGHLVQPPAQSRVAFKVRSGCLHTNIREGVAVQPLYSEIKKKKSGNIQLKCILEVKVLIYFLFNFKIGSQSMREVHPVTDSMLSIASSLVSATFLLAVQLINEVRGKLGTGTWNPELILP